MRLVDVLAWGQKGEMRLRDFQEQMTRASCLRLLACIVILWSAAYLEAAVSRERESGQAAAPEQLSRIFPTATGHIGFLGDYSFQDEPGLATQINDLPLVEPSAEQLPLGLPTS